MKYISSRTLCIFFFALFACEAHAIRKDAAKVIITILTGAAAAEAGSRTMEAKIDHDIARNNLKRRGYNTDDTTIYSLYLSLNNDVSSMMWADIFSKPDIFAVVSIEGQGDYLIPQIHNNYSGQAIQTNIIAKACQPGKRVLITIYDDDTLSDAIWNSILQTRIDCSLGGKFSAFGSVPVSLRSQGAIQLIDRKIVIDAPDYVASAEFKTPRFSFSKDWVAMGSVVDSEGRNLGKLEFGRIWSPDSSPVEAMKDAFGRSVFWGILFVVFSGVCGKYMISMWRSRDTT